MEFIRSKNKRLYCGKKEILLRGFGLGGWLLPEGYMWKFFQKCDRPRRMEKLISQLCGEEYATTFWERYFDTYITEADIRLIAKKGFNSVRLPINARHLYYQKDNMVFFQKETIERIDRLIEWCKKYNIYIVLDMHAAPGGQTGQNIDDSKKDKPELFLDQSYEDELIQLWSEIAKKYAKEPCIAGYDLLNEPLPNWWKQLNHKVLPLYRKLIETIRKEDKNHMIILEGVHWATDFSVFDTFTKEEASDNVLLQFHKYWNEPDKESLEEFLNVSKRLQVPLFMGEGGENNCEWYTTLFPLYERLHISWNFWSYKKMDCENSPVTFRKPYNWDKLLNYLEEKSLIAQEEAISIFDDFLFQIGSSIINEKVFCSLKREVPLSIPAEAFDSSEIYSKRRDGAKLRLSENATLLFKGNKSGKVNYQRYAGEKQPEEENLILHLEKKDQVTYGFITLKKRNVITIECSGKGKMIGIVGEFTKKILIEADMEISFIADNCNIGKNQLTIECEEGYVDVDVITIL